MKKSLPWLGLGVGLVLSLLLFRFSPVNTSSQFTLPLLMALLMAEFGFIITAIAAGISLKDVLKQANKIGSITLLVGNLVLAINFVNQGLVLWSKTGGLGIQ